MEVGLLATCWTVRGASLHYCTGIVVFEFFHYTINIFIYYYYHSLSHSTHTRRISEFFGNGWNRRRLFTPDVWLFKPNTERDLLIVNTEGPPITDWQRRHRRLFFFVGSQNRVNLVLFFKPCMAHSEFFGNENPQVPIHSRLTII